MAKEGEKEKRIDIEEKGYHWPEEKDRPFPEVPSGRTIPEAFLRVCERMGPFAACADDMIGVLTYRKAKLSVLILAKEIKKIPGHHVGVMFPASAGAYLVILAVMMAGKVPVMMNWTLGVQNT